MLFSIKRATGPAPHQTNACHTPRANTGCSATARSKKSRDARVASASHQVVSHAKTCFCCKNLYAASEFCTTKYQKLKHHKMLLLDKARCGAFDTNIKSEKIAPG
eukprot:Skav219124  [mRNA]  locus=scaffold1574:505140:507943:- [translate_table: standard]